MRIVVLGLMMLSLVACGSPSTTPTPTNPNQASFDVAGTWKGTATDTDTTINVTLVLTNNGGTNGLELAGTLTLEGIGAFPFTNSTMLATPGASRQAEIKASDAAGFLYTIRGGFTDKRLDDAILTSSNPALDIDNTLLNVKLEKQ